MITRMPSNYGDDTSPSCVVAGDYVFLAHHAGGHESSDIAHQMRASFTSLGKTLSSVGASFSDIVKINLYLRDIKDFRQARDVFPEFFTDGFPARMTTTTDFFSPQCLCMLDAIAYKPRTA